MFYIRLMSAAKIIQHW